MSPDWNHPSDLALERMLARELVGSEVAEVTTHLDACPMCRARWHALQADDELPLPRRPAQRSRLPLALGGLGVSLLAAAVVLFAIRAAPPPPDSGFTAKGGGLVLELWAHDGDEPRALDWDDTVAPDERLGFRVQLDDGAYVMIVGVDDHGATYLGFPQDGSDASAWIDAEPAPHTLRAGLRFDPRPGHEHVVAIACPEPFGFEAVAERLRAAVRQAPWVVDDPLVDEHCDQVEVRLHKGEEAP